MAIDFRTALQAQATKMRAAMIERMIDNATGLFLDGECAFLADPSIVAIHL